VNARNLCLLCRTLVFVCAGTWAGVSPFRLKAQPARWDLQAGATPERQLAGGEAHVYDIPGEVPADPTGSSTGQVSSDSPQIRMTAESHLEVLDRKRFVSGGHFLRPIGS
jgi:hypothetical protein